MSMRVFSHAPRDIWREVIAESPSALPEHSPEWLDAITSSGRYEDASRLYEFRDGRRIVMPLVRRRGAPGGWLGSFPAGWGIGGPVGAGIDADAVRAIASDLAGVGAIRVSVRPDPLTGPMWADALDQFPVVALPKRAHVLDLSDGIDAVRERLPAKGRRNIRTAQRKGVTVETDSTGRLLPQYYQLFLRSIDRWAGRQHEPLALARWRSQRRDPIEKLYEVVEKMNGAAQVSIAFVEGHPAAGTIVLHGRTAHYTRGSMDRELAGPTCASVLAQWTAIEAAAAAGCTAYHMGDSGQSASLAAYKEQFGARPFDYSEYRLEKLPVTRADIALRSAVKRLLKFQDA